jgi:hypothetical protein
VFPQLFTQSKLKDAIKDLGSPKGKAKLLRSRLKETNVMAAGIFVYWYRSWEQEFTSCFSQGGDSVLLLFHGLIQKFGVEYEVNEWRLLIDYSKRNLKAVLLHNGSNYASLPIGHSAHLKKVMMILKWSSQT